MHAAGNDPVTVASWGHIATRRPRRREISCLSVPTGVTVLQSLRRKTFRSFQRRYPLSESRQIELDIAKRRI
ncbi:unnamed protein product [Sphagnum balticum]